MSLRGIHGPSTTAGYSAVPSKVIEMDELVSFVPNNERQPEPKSLFGRVTAYLQELATDIKEAVKAAPKALMIFLPLIIALILL